MQKTWVQSLGWEDPLQEGTPVFWPGEFHGLYSPWGRKELGMTEWLEEEESMNKGKLNIWFSMFNLKWYWSNCVYIGDWGTWIIKNVYLSFIFVEIKFAYNEVRLQFNGFSFICWAVNHHYNLILEQLHHLQNKSLSIPLLTHFQTLTIHKSTFSIYLPILDMSYKRDNTICEIIHSWN